ncbi:F-box only protein 42-like isoform X2 [Erythrolamprus reginae]|uniref:F-box only protein 42-like isoform X2 n=1 Tax=Erythrolamprus reginae TaxID=121349 RepID=UPI00396C6BE1
MFSAASNFLAFDGWKTPLRRWSWAAGGLWHREAASAPQSQGADFAAAASKVDFYVVWSLREPPRQLSSNCHRKCYQTRLPLPLPKQFVIFGLGDWSHYSQKTSITVDVVINPDIKPQRIGKLGPETRCLVWKGDWRVDIFMASFKQADNGNPIKLLLTVKEEDGNQSSAMCHKEPVLEKSHSPPMEKLLMLPAPTERQAKKKTCLSNLIQLNKTRRTLFEVSATQKQDESEDLEVKELQVCPSARCYHAMCLCDKDIAVLIGGEGADQQFCKDVFWKLEIDNDFWFPMDFPTQNSIPQCSQGHSATYDPDTKRIYIFGGIKEGRRYNNIYVLDTTSWKWLHVFAKGKVPTLAFHSATVYRKELFVFGGAFPKMSSLEMGACSNALFIFNPDYEIWYQPIVEGEKPLPRLGHSATLLKNKLVIFGGQKTSTYLSDTHILDLGFMEYKTVPLLSGQPSARSFHAAIQISDQKMLISGGCNAKGAFQDAFIFHLDTLIWSAIKHRDLCAVPRAGHTLLNLSCTNLTNTDKEKLRKKPLCTVLVFGGSDHAGKFYNSTSKFQLDFSELN